MDLEVEMGKRSSVNGRASSGATQQTQVVYRESGVREVLDRVVRNGVRIHLSSRTCLKMFRKLILASQRELGVAIVTGHPGHVLVLVVAVEPRGPGVTGVANSALVTTRVSVYPRTSNRLSGISLVSSTKKSRLSILFVFVGRMGGADDTAVHERG